MGILSRALKRTDGEEERQLSLTDYQGWVDAGLVRSSAAGVSVTPDTAMALPAVYACVRVLAEAVASLPLITYRRQGEGRARATDYYLYNLLHDQPNPVMTSFEYREMMMGHVLTWGNHLSEIQWSTNGRIQALWPLRPDRVEKVEQTPDGLVYHYRLPNGGIEELAEWQVFHVRGLSSDGIWGWSPIRMQREALGVGLAAQEFGARFFGNGTHMGGILSHPGVLGDKAFERLRTEMSDRWGGLANANRMAILEEGMTYTRIGIPPEDAQFLETRKFQVTEIARMYLVPPHKIMDLERATFTNIEHQAISFVVDTLRPWLVRLEQAIHSRLMSERERQSYFVEFLVDGLLRGDAISRSQVYSVGRQWGYLSANDIRRMENMNPIAGGDDYLMPLNMVPAGAEPPARALRALETMTPAGVEQRALRSINARRRLQLVNTETYREAAARVLRREINDVGAQAKRQLSQRDAAQFVEWLDDFYEEHRAFVITQMRAVMDAYLRLVAAEAGDETAAISEERLAAFVQAYLETYADRHTTISRQQVADALATDDPLTALEQVFDGWRDTRPGTIAGNETVRGGGAITKIVYAAAGVSMLRWRSVGDTCPYCRRLDGMVVSIEANFLAAGQDFQPEGAERPLRPGRDVGHPPAHLGCDCVITPG